MEEKVIVKSEHYSLTIIRSYLYGILGGCIVIDFILYFLNFDRSRGSNHRDEYWTILDNPLLSLFGL